MLCREKPLVCRLHTHDWRHGHCEYQSISTVSIYDGWFGDRFQESDALRERQHSSPSHIFLFTILGHDLDYKVVSRKRNAGEDELDCLFHSSQMIRRLEFRLQKATENSIGQLTNEQTRDWIEINALVGDTNPVSEWSIALSRIPSESTMRHVNQFLFWKRKRALERWTGRSCSNHCPSGWFREI